MGLVRSLDLGPALILVFLGIPSLGLQVEFVDYWGTLNLRAGKSLLRTRALKEDYESLLKREDDKWLEEVTYIYFSERIRHI